MGPRPYSQVGTTVFRKPQKYMIRQTRNYHAILNRYKKKKWRVRKGGGKNLTLQWRKEESRLSGINYNAPVNSVVVMVHLRMWVSSRHSFFSSARSPHLDWLVKKGRRDQPPPADSQQPASEGLTINKVSSPLKVLLTERIKEEFTSEKG
jgi:hypothetical protein